MQILLTLFYTAVTLGVLIFFHELGHFLAAKFTGMRVDRFSMGFPPRAFGKKVGDTDYCVSWIPIGGYVKIAGMVDESFDTDHLNRPPEPWEFRSRPMWARMLVISAGVIMNVLLATGIFWTIHYLRSSYIAETTVVGYVVPGSVFAKAGLQEEDSIVAVNGKSVTEWDQVQNQIYVENMGNEITLDIRRGTSNAKVVIPPKAISPSMDMQPDMYIGHSIAFIEAVEIGKPADKMGLKPGDTIRTLNGEAVTQPRLVAQIKANAGKPVTLAWKRGDSILSGTATVTSEGRIGIQIASIYAGPKREVRYTLFQAFPEGVRDVIQSVHLVSLTVSKLFAGKASVKESLGGPIAIAQMATQSAESGFLVFIWFMAQLSMSLAILNILPFPALDGGHLALLLYEKVFGREIPNKVKIIIQQAGFILLLAFMVFVIYNDISKF
jgi:regulator of sigma E protease